MSMKYKLQSWLCILAFCMTASANAQQYKYVEIGEKAPFEMAAIKEFIYPERTFDIRKYGAKADGKTLCSKAINKAISACSKSGGGHVVVPAGEWLTGAVHLQSNVDLHLEEGAKLIFTDNPADYLPAVRSTWEGVECMNYSPLVYAYECKNVKLSGTGTLAPKMELWKTWFARPAEHIEATRHLYTWGAEDYPIEQRNLTALKGSNMRPHLIQMNRCQNVVLENFHIREAPFWTIHIYMCDETLVRGLDVYAHGHNNDGIDIDMSSKVLVENCKFNQGDDAVVIKAGRNRDAWRINKPSENIVIRNCTITDGHTLLGLGSELSGGIRNVWMHDCEVNGVVTRLCYLKTNHRRGGFVENVTLENVKTTHVQRVLAIATDVVYQWKDFPDYETKYTRIDGLHMRNVECDSADVVIDLQCDEHLPAKNISIDNLSVGKAIKDFCNVKNVTGLSLNGVNLK